MSILSIDIGTSGIKAVIFSEHGNILGFGYQEYEIFYPKIGWAEINPKKVFEQSIQAIRQANKANTSKDDVTCLSISTMGEVACPLSKKGDLLYNAILHFDKRGEEEKKLWEEFGKERIYKITGMPLHSMYTINKLLWLKNNEPDIYRRTNKFLLFQDYFLYNLGLDPLIDYSLASRTMAFNIVNKKWSEEILNFCGIDKKIFSKPVESGFIVGSLSAKYSSILGLKKGIKVIVGAHDQPAAVLGAGVLNKSVAMDSTGTVECIAVTSDKPILDKTLFENNINCYCHCIPEKYIIHGFVFSAGSILKWYRDTFCFEESQIAKRKRKTIFEIIDEKLNILPASIFLLPHFSGSGTPYLDSMSKGAMIGLTLNTSKSDIAKAILEGISFEMKLNINILKKAGININELRAIGGGAKSENWLQLKADIFRLKVLKLNVSEAACMGVAMIAGKSTGLFNSLQEAIDSMIKVDKMYFPNKDLASKYKDRMTLYLKIYESVKDINHYINRFS